MTISFWLDVNLEMGPGRKEDPIKPKGGSECFKTSIIFLLLNICNFIVPVTGFSLKTCRISYETAICSKNQLTAVPGDVPSTVKGFDLSSNKIPKIQVSDFKSLSLLTKLDLKDNRISQIDKGAFADLTSLEHLNLTGNKLVKLEDNLFDGLTNLKELRMDHNHIKEVSSTSFKSLRNLTFLDISYNNLQHLTQVHSILHNLPKLQCLFIQNNSITTFQSWELTNSSLELNNISLSQNPIAVFKITADVFPHLTQLSISGFHGEHQTIWDVQNKTFLSRVSNLDISGLQMAFDDVKKVLWTVNSSLTHLSMNRMKHNLSALITISCNIPTVSTLQLQHNNLRSVPSDLLHSCNNLTKLDLSSNEMRCIRVEAFRSMPGLRILNLKHNRLLSVPAAIQNLTALAELDLSSNEITTLECQDFAKLTNLKQLNLYLNSITSLKVCVFKDLTQLRVLKLQSNQISKLNGAFRKYLPNLRQLSLNNNTLNSIKNGELEGLKSLTNLSLHDNKIAKFDNASFIGLINLIEITLQSNKITPQEIHKGCFKHLINLRRLDLRDNHIRYTNSSPLPEPPFSQLSRLKILSMTGQRHREKSELPSNILQGLTNLSEFHTRNSQLLSLPNDMFTYTPQLQTLDISSNDLVDLSPELFFPIQSLKNLYMSRTSLRSLDFLMDANLTKLEFMQARRNVFSVISEEVMRSLPGLVYVDFQGNTFTCDCNNIWFIQWANTSSQTQVFDAYNFECNYPRSQKGKKLLEFDVRSCSGDTDFICFVSTTCTIILFLVVSFTYHFLRWQLAYAYYYFLAFLFEAKNSNKKAPIQYDAFVSYNTHDEPWVIRELLPKLEGEQGWRLCLHHRDFEPGKPIIENITDAIYGSRKTICVISRRYLESEWCSKEIQVASFRLFDEQKDVLILVFLEEIPAYLLSPFYRMRKLLKRRTYLSWPRAGGYTELFWEKLRQALRPRSDLSEDRSLLHVVDVP